MPSAAGSFTRSQLLNATTSQPWTKNFRHMLHFPKKFLKRFGMRDASIKSVRPRDRIKYWNIVPGDQIRLLGDKKNTLHEVLSINRFSNRVFVKGQANVSDAKCIIMHTIDIFGCRLEQRMLINLLQARIIITRGASYSLVIMSYLLPASQPNRRLYREWFILLISLLHFLHL